MSCSEWEGVRFFIVWVLSVCVQWQGARARLALEPRGGARSKATSTSVTLRCLRFRGGAGGDVSDDGGAGLDRYEMGNIAVEVSKTAREGFAWEGHERVYMRIVLHGPATPYELAATGAIRCSYGAPDAWGVCRAWLPVHPDPQTRSNVDLLVMQPAGFARADEADLSGCDPLLAAQAVSVLGLGRGLANWTCALSPAEFESLSGGTVELPPQPPQPPAPRPPPPPLPPLPQAPQPVAFGPHLPLAYEPHRPPWIAAAAAQPGAAPPLPQQDVQPPPPPPPLPPPPPPPPRRDDGLDDRWRVMSLNCSGLTLAAGGAPPSESAEARLRVIRAHVALWRPGVACLQELGGGQAALVELRDRLREDGYEADYLAGESTSSGYDSHRRGGVMVAWRQRLFRADTGCSRSRDARQRPGFALFGETTVDDMLERGRVTASVAAGLRDYQGRRSLAVRLIRKRGPLTNKPIVVGSVYVPASASESVRAGFIYGIADALRKLSCAGVEWVCPGDWQASPDASWRAGGAPNKAHDDALATCFWVAGDGDGEAGPAGVAIPLGLEHGLGRYTFHSAQGSHRTIDHAFVNAQAAVAWRVAAGGLTFMGGHGAEHDGDSLFDHRVLLLESVEGEVERLGIRRAHAVRLKKPKARAQLCTAMEHFIADWSAPADEELARLEAFFAGEAGATTKCAAADPEKLRAKPARDLEQQLSYYRGIVDMITSTVGTEDESPEHEMHLCRFFGACTNRGLYRAGFLAAARDRELKRAPRRGVKLVLWRQLRDVMLREAQRAYTRLQPQAAAARKAERDAIRLGTQEPADGQTLARQLQTRQRQLGAAERAAGFTVTSLRGANGELETGAAGVHAVAHAYGVKQNGPSSCNLEAMGAWLAAFVPRGDAMRLPNGAAWTLRGAIPFEVFAREVQRAASAKAPALHAFLVDHLQVLPTEHPALETYYELLMRCMESGVYPAHYLELIAVLIPKTYGNTVDISALRDIWLINHGAKLAERCLLHTALAPLSRRYSLVAAGGCKGRGCIEQAFALHAAISDAIATRTPLYVLYVDLIKCFMSFSRQAGEMTAAWAGMPQPAIDALRGLCDSLKHGVVTGRYETAFGSTEAFEILRGFLQGALGSPESCKCMMNTLAEALELKIVGYNSFTPDGGGAYLTQLIFVDDAANSTSSMTMMERVALFWSCWCRVTGCQMNIAERKKTVLSGLEWERRKDGSTVPVSTQQSVYICGLAEGDPARMVPNMPVNECYKYVGIWTRLDGQHWRRMLPFLATKVRDACATATRWRTSRRLTVGHANSCILGNGFFYGGVVGSDMDTIEKVVGVAARSCVSGRRCVAGRQRDRSAPRLQLHAPQLVRQSRANEPTRDATLSAAGRSAFVTGYGLAHPYPALMAACVMTFVNSLATPLDTPAHVQSMGGLARVLWIFGCRAAPLRDEHGVGGFQFGEQADALDQNDVIERAVWAICRLGRGQMCLVHHLPPSSPLHPDRWPGYPEGWQPLWYGGLWQLRLANGAKRASSRPLMHAGVAELANLCDASGGRYLPFAEAAGRCRWLKEFGARRDYETLVSFLVAAGVTPVPGRRPWAAADVKAGVCPTYAPQGFGAVMRERRREYELAKHSGDGGRLMASQLGLTNRPEWLPAVAATGDEASGMPPSPAVPPARAAPRQTVNPPSPSGDASSWAGALATASHEGSSSLRDPERAPTWQSTRPSRPGKAAGMAAARAMDADEGEAEEARQQREVWGSDAGHVGSGAWAVDRLLDRRLDGGVWQYLVRFKGWGPEHDLWEPACNVHGMLVAAYDAVHPRPAEAVDAGGSCTTDELPSDIRCGCAAALGEAQPRAMEEVVLPGADQLSLDGRSRREVHSYQRKQEVSARSWKVRREGGHHEQWQGRGQAWLSWAQEAYTIGDDGWLQGDLAHVGVPRAALFWVACEAKIRGTKRVPNAAECQFVFRQLLHIEATMPVSHFCASDGSRKEATKEQKKQNDVDPHVGRVVVAHDGSTLSTLGGGLWHERLGIERHSFEAELAGFHDHLAATRDTVTVIVTDCLSGAQAAGRFRSRTQADKATRHRGQELDNIDALEERHRAVVYLWVHSHIGITPNEAADAECDRMRDSAVAELDLMPSRFALVRFAGLKRGVGRFAFEFFEALLLRSFESEVHHTMLPMASTWQPFANARKHRVMREADVDMMEDARANRCGLMADRLVHGHVQERDDGSEAAVERRRAYRPKKGSWEWFRQGCDCPCCSAQPDARQVHVAGVFADAGGQRQTVWHMLTTCSPSEEAIGGKRAAAAGWLARHVADFGTRQAEYALTAITGGAASLDASQGHTALRFLLGLPDAPPEGWAPDERALAQGYGRYFCARMADILRAGVAARVRLEAGLHLQARRREVLTRSEWMRRRGLREIWGNREWSVKCFRAMRLNALRAWRRDATLQEATAAWELRAAFERLRLRLDADPRVLPRREPDRYRFDLFECAPCVPEIALVHLRHAADAPAEVAIRRRAEAATRIAARARAKAARARARETAKAARAAAVLQRHVRAVMARGRRQGVALFSALGNAADREAARRATAAAIARVRLSHRLATSTGQALGPAVRRMDAAAERAERESATRRVIERMRNRHVLTKHARRGGRAMVQVMRRLTGDAAREAHATSAAIARLRAVHRARQAEAAEGGAAGGGAARGGAAAHSAAIRSNTAASSGGGGAAEPSGDSGGGGGSGGGPVRCDAGHRMRFSRAHVGQADLPALTCDVCLDPIGPRAGRWSCTPCDWDACVDCGGDGAKATPAQQIASDVAALARAARERARTRAHERAENETLEEDRARRDAREHAREVRAREGSALAQREEGSPRARAVQQERHLTVARRHGGGERQNAGPANAAALPPTREAGAGQGAGACSRGSGSAQAGDRPVGGDSDDGSGQPDAASVGAGGAAALARGARASERAERKRSLAAIELGQEGERENGRRARAQCGSSGARERERADGEEGRPPRTKMTRAAAGSRENV